MPRNKDEATKRMKQYRGCISAFETKINGKHKAMDAGRRSRRRGRDEHPDPVQHHQKTGKTRDNLIMTATNMMLFENLLCHRIIYND